MERVSLLQDYTKSSQMIITITIDYNYFMINYVSQLTTTSALQFVVEFNDNFVRRHDGIHQ